MWQEINGKLVNTYTFNDFDEAWAFMEQVAEIAKQLNHHPRWLNEYNVVSFELFSHEENKITEKDKQLAVAIDNILK